jgi:hypothetical protein
MPPRGFVNSPTVSLDAKRTHYPCIRAQGHGINSPGLVGWSGGFLFCMLRIA